MVVEVVVQSVDRTITDENKLSFLLRLETEDEYRLLNGVRNLIRVRVTFFRQRRERGLVVPMIQ